MLLMQIFLPRFLVLEVVLFFHFIQQGYCGCSDSTEEDDAGCSIDVGPIPTKNPPLFFHNNGEELLLPCGGSSKKNEFILRVSAGDNLTASCPGTSFRSDGAPTPVLSFKCLSNKHFSKDSKELTDDAILPELSCSKSIQETVVDMKDSPCGPPDSSASLIQVGWPTPAEPSDFVTQLTICHSKAMASTLYTIHTLHGEAIAAADNEAARPTAFKEGRGFFSESSPANAYNQRTQAATFQELCGHKSSTEFFSSRRFYLARGHLSPDADYVYKEWQDATYYYFNVVPQWQTFNNGNWKAVESIVRKFAEANRKTLNIYTGIFGQLHLPNDNGDMIPISLAHQKNQIPVPELLWKVVHDNSGDANKAIVFVGVNNPHTTFEKYSSQGLHLCPSENFDLCSNLKWNFQHQKDSNKGILYCCSYKAVKKVIEWIPDLGDPDLLSFEDPTLRTSPRRRRPTRDVQECSIELHVEPKRQLWPPLFYNTRGKPLLPRRIRTTTSNQGLSSSGNVDNNLTGDGPVEAGGPTVISVNEMETVIVACPGSRLRLTGQTQSEFRCQNNQLLSSQEMIVNYSNLSCSKSIEESVIKTNVACGPTDINQGHVARIGWTVSRVFNSMIEVCHINNVNLDHTHYAVHNITGSALAARDRNGKRKSSFREGSGFYLKSVASHLYKVRNQEKVFNSSGLGRFIKSKRDHFLTKGHLAPNGDFVYKEWQDATFYFMNVAPQWKKFNSGNWLSVEQKVRDFAEVSEMSLTVYTGTHAILQLPNEAGHLQDVFLDESHRIPVPLFYWKLIHEPQSNEAMVFIGVNMPSNGYPINNSSDDDGGNHDRTIPSHLLLCPDICDDFRWYFDRKHVLDRGLLYCCSYQSFKEALPWIDFLDSPGALLNIDKDKQDAIENRRRSYRKKFPHK